MPILQLAHVTKRFSGHTAVRDLTLDIPAGGIFGLLGPNGAGKTTTIRMMLDIIEPDEGTITRFGGIGSARALAHRIGFLPEERGLYKAMPVQEHLAFFGELKGLRHREAVRRAEAWLGRLGLADWADRKVEDLSKGMQQKVQFAGALLHDPELVLLDEPFSGLDPVNSQVLRDVVVDLARQGRTVLFSTHIMEHAEQMCDRIAIIARGALVVNGKLSEVKSDFGHRFLALRYTGGQDAAARVLADRRLVARVDDHGSAAEAELADGADPAAILAALVQAGVGLARFEVVEPSLQSIFIAKVGADAAVAPAQGGQRA
jgi:ABC-2 type transport system ATP-binding protein